MPPHQLLAGSHRMMSCRQHVSGAVMLSTQCAPQPLVQMRGQGQYAVRGKGVSLSIV